MSHYEQIRDADVPRRVRFGHTLRLVSVVGVLIYGFLWFSVSSIFVLFLMSFCMSLSESARRSPAAGIVVGLIYLGLLVAYPIRVGLRFAKARRLIREGTFVTGVLESAREFRAGRRGLRATGTAFTLRLPQDLGVGSVSFVLDGRRALFSLSAGDEVPVLVVPGSSYCAAFPGGADLVPAGEAQSLLVRTWLRVL